MPISKMHYLWIGFGERRKKVHVIQDNDQKLTVIVRQATRDAKTGKMSYKVFDSFDVGGASPEQVYATVKEAVLRKAAQPVK